MLRTYVRSGQNERPRVGLGEERVDRLLQLLPERLVLEPAVLVEPRRRMTDGDFAFHHPRTDGCEDFPQLGLGPDRPEGPGARADDRDRLVPERVRRERAGRPSRERSSASPESKRCIRASRRGPRPPRRSHCAAPLPTSARLGRRRPPRRTGAPPSHPGRGRNRPPGRSSSAARRSFVLYESRRRLPEIARTFIALTPP